MKYTSGNDRRTARMPIAPMDSQPEFAVDPCQENGSAMLVEPVILERSYKERMHFIHVPKGPEHAVRSSTFIQAIRCRHG